jgi:glutathione S-transferase
MAWLKGRIDGAFNVVERHLAGRAWLVGAAPTIADFSLSGYLFFPTDESGIDLATTYPNIAAWVARLQALPGWENPYTLMPGEQIAPRW